MTTYGTQSYKMRQAEAMGVADTLLKENSNLIQILAKILPQMASAADSRLVGFNSFNSFSSPYIWAFIPISVFSIVLFNVCLLMLYLDLSLNPPDSQFPILPSF
jgi:hypothetical protein